MSEPIVAMQFDDAAQQREAATLGMWTFLATEVLFFGGALMAYTFYDVQWSQQFESARKELLPWFGAFNTAVLLLSSFTMAMAVHSAHIRATAKRVATFMLLTVLFGSTFLGVKCVEYYKDWEAAVVPHFNFDASKFTAPGQAGHVQIFFFFYFALTMIHALHMIIGIVLILTLVARSRKPGFVPNSNNAVEMMGLYWHFVDVVWIFLFPILYLIH